MNTIDTNQLLMQLRAAASVARGTPAPVADENAGANFSTFLRESIGQVNAMQQQATDMKNAVSAGDTSVSLAETMIAASKAELGFQTMVQTRNKLVDAYQEIMRMQV